jgi:hypothetical protein
MSEVSRQHHWENVYATKGESEVSWFQRAPTQSLELMTCAGATTQMAVIDIGGGASRLVDSLVAMNFHVAWVVADVTSWEPHRTYDLWHDRAAFHFLTEERDRAAYIARLTKSLKLGGHAIIATFAPDGPERCSGLPVMRYDAESLGQALGGTFELIETRRDEHLTPWGSKQRFQFSMFRRGCGSTQ